MIITDRQKKKIIADYLETQSVNAAAKRNKVSWKTAKQIIDAEEDIEQKLELKKEQNTADILAYMESQREAVCNIIGIALEVLPDKIRNAKTASEVTTALGTLIDKFTFAGKNVVSDTVEDDPLTKSLKEEAERMNGDAES